MTFCIRESEYDPAIHDIISGPSDTCSDCGTVIPTPAGSPVHVPVIEQTSSRIGVTIIFEEVVEEGTTRVEIFGYDDAENINLNWETDVQYLGNVILEFKLPESYTLEDFNNFRVFDTFYYSDSSFTVLDITISEGQYAPDFATRRVYGLSRSGEAVLSALNGMQPGKGRSGGTKTNNSSIYPGDCEKQDTTASTCCLPTIFTVYGDCSCVDCTTADTEVNGKKRQTGAVVVPVGPPDAWWREYECKCNCKDQDTGTWASPSDRYICGGGCKTEDDFKCNDANFDPSDCRCECTDDKKACTPSVNDDGSAFTGETVCVECNKKNYALNNKCQCVCGGDDESSYDEDCKGECLYKCELLGGDNYKRNTQTCDCECTGCGENEDPVGPPCECRCKSGFERCKGECRQECGDLEIRNTETCACECVDSSQCPPGQARLKDETHGCECRCTSIEQCDAGKEFDDYTCKCVCDDPGKVLCGGECKTPCPTGQEYDQECDCKCSDLNKTLCGGNCYGPCEDIEFEEETVSGSRNENCDCVYEVSCYVCARDENRTRSITKQQAEGAGGVCSGFEDYDGEPIVSKEQECPDYCDQINFNGENISGSWDEESSKCLYNVTCYQCNECPTGRTRNLEKSQIDGKSCSSFTNADTGDKYVSDCGSCRWSCINQSECEPDPEGPYDNQTACVSGAASDCGVVTTSSTPAPRSCWNDRNTQNNSCAPFERCCNGECIDGNIPCECWACDGDNYNCSIYLLPTGYSFCYDFGMAMTQPECESGNSIEGIDPCKECMTCDPGTTPPPDRVCC